MLAQQGDIYSETVEAIYGFNRDEQTRYICEMLEEGERVMLTYTSEIKRLKKENKAAARAIAKKDSALAEMDSALAEKDSALAKMASEMDSALAEKDSALAKKDSALAEMASEMISLKAQIEALQRSR